MGVSILAIGIPWFLIVLFMGRMLFDYLHLKLNNAKFPIVIIVCTLFGLFFSKYQWLPLSLDLTFCIMPFFYFGNYFKKINMKYRTTLYGMVAFGVWIITLWFCYIFENNYMELACRRFTLFPICYITALAATMFIGYFCVKTVNKRMAKPFVYIGENSMYILWMHIMDYLFRIIWKWSNSDYINAVIRISVDIVLSIFLINLINLVKKYRLEFVNLQGIV